MSCQIKISATIVDVPGVRRCLFPWDDNRGSENWLHNCLISVSPTGEIVTLANNDRIVVLSAKWDSNAVLSNYHISFSGTLEGTTDPITAVLCLPIASQNQSSQVGPDWTCIVVGFKTGVVKFYTESCNLLLTEQFHDDQINNIKCQSQNCMHVEVGSDFRPEELYIQYSKCICVLSGAQLFTTLRNCRSQLARVQAKGDSSLPSAHMLLHKKWGLFDQCELNDVAVVGLDTSNTFNHLLTASTCGGFDARYRAMAPNNTLIIGAGTKPFVGFHYALEGGMQPLLSDVAKAVANKLKSALPGWLVGGKSSAEKSPPPIAIQPAEAVGCRFGLCDVRRTADTIIMSPNKKLSVVTDSLGRIILIDNQKGIAVRLWKGYRGAQCSFLQVPDEERNRQNKSTLKRRTALFLIIYTPKKGTLEVWVLQQGPKIVTFSASKNSKLLYTNYGLMGLTNGQFKNKHNISATCFLMDTDGQMKEITVPFHFALSEKNSKRARDVHLFKRLKQFCKSEEYTLEKLCSEVSVTCSELKTNEIRQQCFDMFISNKCVQPRAAAIMADCFLEKLQIQEVSDSESNRLITLNKNLKLIVEFYMFIEGFYDIDAENGNIPNNNADENLEPEVHVINTRLVIGDKEMHNLQRLLDLSTLNDVKRASEPKVSFKDENKSVFSEYLSLFDLNTSGNNILLKQNVPEDKLYRVAEQIFKTFILAKRNDVEEFKEHMQRSTIRTLDLVKMLLSFWVNRSLDINVNLEEEMQNLSRVLHMICLTTISENICVEYNKVSQFWTEIREYLADSAKPFPALTAAMLCRSVAQRIEQDKEAQQCSSTSLEDDTSTDLWEKLSQENCRWTLLIGKLEDVSLLNIILSNKPICDSCVLPTLFYDRVDISLKYILRKGKGSVSELVAQWLTSGGVGPEYIVVNEMCSVPNELENEASSRPESVEYSSLPNAALMQKNLNVNQPVFDHLNILKKQFPYSIDSSAILANMCWEYALTWQKDMQNLLYLDAMIKCLQLIPNSYIKQGLYNMVWNTHLKQTFESTCKLVNKVGKVPKEILCRQDTGLTDLQIPLYIEFCTTFLDTFMDVLQQCYGSDKCVLRFENLWENGGVPLTELALQQSEINDSLLHLHYQLSLVIQVITTFGIKQTKPVPSLFDSLTINLFFTDLTQNTQVSTHSSEPKLLKSRLQFLLKVINASIETVRVTNDSVYSLDHVNWMAKCVSLASVWGIDTDLLRKNQVLLLYTNGFNTLAEEILPSIGNTEALGADILAIAGKQLKKLLMSSEDLTGKVVALSPSLSQYLETLDKSWCAPGTLESITYLAEYAVRCLPETNSHSRQASLLLDACLTLRGMEN